MAIRDFFGDRLTVENPARLSAESFEDLRRLSRLHP
jgi:hypothetical protein